MNPLIESDFFSVLSKYKQPENFLSNSLVFVLKSLLNSTDNKSRIAGYLIMSEICQLPFTAAEHDSIRFRLQRNLLTPKSEEETLVIKGVVDICISTNTKSIFIEVKDSAKVENNQLTKYRAALEHEKIHNPRLTTKLILLTRASTNPDEERNADLIVFWPTLYFVVNRIITTKRLLPADTINTYILSSFENYLRENRMSIKKIKKTIVGSWDSVYHLLNMLDLASKEINLKPSSYFSDQDIGYRFQNGRYWLFLSWDNPKIIYFGVDPSMIFNKKKKARIEKLPIVNEVRSISRELDNQFFELSADLQLNKIAKLVGEMYAEIIL